MNKPNISDSDIAAAAASHQLGTPISDPEYFQIRDIDTVVEDGRKKRKKRKICGAFLYENTTTLLFSRTNYGKSILAFQFAWAAATGTDLDSCSALKNECEPMKVLVVDLELEDDDLAERHGMAVDSKNPYSKNLLYMHERIDNPIMIGFPLLDKIEQAAVLHESKLVVIDNISKLLPDAVKPDTAAMVISVLNRIRIKTGASIFVIGHTTKGNPLIRIHPTDYYGSAMLQNFFHELSFLDQTKDGDFFLCHSKTKKSETYNKIVPVFFRGEHPCVGYGFNFVSLQSLADIQLPIALTNPSRNRTRNLSKFKKEISVLLAGGFTQVEIADLCNVNHSSISRLCSSSPDI